MSVTFTIANNSQYVDAHCPELIQKTTYDCECKEESKDGSPDPLCRECSGSGKETFYGYPFEVNMTNANFRTLMSALGMEVEDFGELDPRRLRKAVQRIPAALIQREDRQENDNLYIQGISEIRAQSYLTKLLELTREAERREDKIVWS